MGEGPKGWEAQKKENLWYGQCGASWQQDEAGGTFPSASAVNTENGRVRMRYL